MRVAVVLTTQALRKAWRRLRLLAAPRRRSPSALGRQGRDAKRPRRPHRAFFELP
jgi:hypothetical protein